MSDVFQIAAKNLTRKFGGKAAGGAKPLQPASAAPQGATPLPSVKPNPYDDWTDDELEAEILRRGPNSPSIPVIQKILRQRSGKMATGGPSLAATRLAERNRGGK